MGNENLLFQPIFVVGNSRSGTTMMGRILGGSNNVFTFHEIHFFEQLWSEDNEIEKLSYDSTVVLFANLLSVQREGYLAQRNPRAFEQEAAQAIELAGANTMRASEVFRFFLQYEAQKNGKQRACDQTPRNIFYIEEILKLYPDARFINMVRDPRDVLLSQKQKWRRRFLGAGNIPLKEAFRARINYHPITISKIWNSSIKSSLRFKDHSSVLTVFFEELLNDPQAIVNSICEFLKIPFEKSMLDIPQVGSSSGKDQRGRKGINLGRTEAWRSKNALSDSEVFWCQRINGTLMDNLGYARAEVKPSRLKLFGSAVIFPVQLSIALLLNLNRMKNIVSALKKRLQ